MRRVKVVVVEPEGKINMGFIIRLAKNFSVDELCVVSPKFPLNDPEVIEFSAKASDYLNNVRVEKELRSCLEGASLIVCTTSKGDSRRDTLRTGVPPSLLREIAGTYENIAVVFGRESVGLTRKELKYCDIISSVNTGGEYNVLNLSHAVALYLYELKVKGKNKGEEIPCNIHTLEAIRYLVTSIGKQLKNERGAIALKHVLFRGGLQRSECGAIYKLLKEIHVALTNPQSKSLKNP